MILPEIITGGLQFLKVTVLADGKLQMTLYALHKGRCRRLVEEVPGKKALLFVLIGGNGVLQKNYREGAVGIDRIAGNAELLCFKEMRGQEVLLTFMRRDKVEEIISVLKRKGMQVYGVYLTGEKEGSCSSPQSPGLSFFLQLRKEEMKYRKLFRTDRKGGMLAEHVFRRLRLPLLCFWLVVLIADYFVSTMLEERLRRQEMMLTARVRESEGKNREDEGLRILSEKVKKWSVDGCALLLDKIARQLPREVHLTELTVAPLTEKLRTGREPGPDTGNIVIVGEAPGSGVVSRFCRLLEKEKFCREVELKSVSRMSGQEIYRFEIRLRF